MQDRESETHKTFPIICRTSSRLAYAETEGGASSIFMMATGVGVPRRVCSACGLPRTWVPESDRILVLLTNRVHPVAAPVAMQKIRGEFHRLALRM